MQGVATEVFHQTVWPRVLRSIELLRRHLSLDLLLLSTSQGVNSRAGGLRHFDCRKAAVLEQSSLLCCARRLEHIKTIITMLPREKLTICTIFHISIVNHDHLEPTTQAFSSSTTRTVPPQPCPYTPASSQHSPSSPHLPPHSPTKAPHPYPH